MINLKDPNWRCLGPERTKERGVWPNRLWHNKSTKEGALVVVHVGRQHLSDRMS
jgi:hypothetical protein